MSRLLELSTGCRLHFGLLELAEGQPNRYGGLGLMLETPKLRLRWHAHSDAPQTWFAPTVEIERRIQLAQTHALAALSSRYDVPVNLPGMIEVLDCPPMHSGLGVGTQLATAVAQLTLLAVQDDLSANVTSHTNDVEKLAWLSGRGKRSAIGLHGFLHGGLVRDLGYATNTDSEHATLTTQSEAHRLATVATSQLNENAGRPVHTQGCLLPRDWMVVLCCSCNSGDVHGKLEDQLIGRAAAHTNPHRERMLSLSNEALQAAQSDDFLGFAQVLDEYMELASRLFASVQAGRYRDAQTAFCVEQLQLVGLSGVGQSSWGPTVFGFAPNSERAQVAADQLSAALDSNNYRIVIARPKTSGAQWSMPSASGKQHAG